MRSVNKTQLAVIAGSLILIVLLLFANTRIPANKEENPSEHAGAPMASMETVVQGIKEKLTAAQKQQVAGMETAISNSANKKAAYEAIINLFDSLSQPLAAAYYMEQAANASPNEPNRMESANRYYGATRFVEGPEKQLLYQKAIEAYSKVMELNPANSEAKINLAACYVEGSSDPMKGIGMLRELEKTDSNNINLQLNFAFFSERSGQWDKAIKRFEKVLKIQPDFIEAYLHLADAYQQMGDKEKAIENLEKYKNSVDDVSIKTEIQDYINKLKTN